MRRLGYRLYRAAARFVTYYARIFLYVAGLNQVCGFHRGMFGDNDYGLDDDNDDNYDTIDDNDGDDDDADDDDDD